MTLRKCSLSGWFSTQNFLYTVLDNTTPLWVCIFKQFTHLVSLGIFYKSQKIAMWARSYIWNLILALLICSSHLQLDNFFRVLQKSPLITPQLLLVNVSSSETFQLQTGKALPTHIDLEATLSCFLLEGFRHGVSKHSSWSYFIL